ncbi:uncharacterized protein [Nerophis lumbriciformis]|uniref:uncharacterized protein n=1 Tax=Nerophis lumbriciformis TaxID=546530 RepID=UPI002AE01EE3|nr:uncharacterized protein LOC133618987 [Nerophis lumbriciformis]XP_061835832.1 uncharacterized protein LOC133618987 [Nerophis lumbriciformis]
MYTEGGQATAHRRFIHGPCPCQRCDQHGGLRYQPALSKQADHQHLEGRRDFQSPRVKDEGWRTPREDRGNHCSPQRWPRFMGSGPLHQSNDLPRLCRPCELNSSRWDYLPEASVTHCPSFRECVVTHSHPKAHLFNGGIPHPLPHLRVKGQGCGYSRTVQYNAFVGNREEGCAHFAGNDHLKQNNSSLEQLLVANGHCGPKPGPSKGKEGSNTNQDSGNSPENCNGHSHKSFFATEVPQKHLNQKKGPSARPPAIINSDVDQNQHQGVGLAKQTRGHDAVKDQIRQVVTNLEDVLGGLKQVHVEMKEVIKQIDYLTASIDLSEKPPSITCGSSNNIHASTQQRELRRSPPPDHKHIPVEGSRHSDEERIILRTNSPSPIHMASVVKTRCFTPPDHSKDAKHERSNVNGNPANHKADTSEPRSLNLHSKVVIRNSTVHSRTQKPPPHPRNGRCGNTSNPVRALEYAWKGHQNGSIV